MKRSIQSVRKPAVFWHHLGFRRKGNPETSRLREATIGLDIAEKNDWWRFLLDKGEVPASWENEPGDRGEVLLSKYIKRDRIVVFAPGFGALGWGIVDKPRVVLVEKESAEDVFPESLNRHRLTGIKWKNWTEHLEAALPAAAIKKIGVPTPNQTRQQIKPEAKANALIRLMARMFAHRTASVGSNDDPDIAQERAAGFQSDPKIRRAIEKYAMKKAQKELETQGYEGFEDTSSYECYDYRCQKQGQRHYVEVKGLQNNPASVNVTYAEVEHAKEWPNNSILVLVHSIRLVRTNPIKLGNGRVVVRKKWQPQERDLKPISYFWTLK